MVTLKQIRPGSIVILRGSFGQGQREQATVTEVEADIKNGRPGIDYVTKTSGSSWAYLSQVEEVVAY